VHIPYVATPEYRSKYAEYSSNEQDYYGAITAMDEQIGRLRMLLQARGVANDTVIFFTSDNGPEISPTIYNNQTSKGWPFFPNPGSTGGLRGRKRDLTEGGIRVPGLVEWPASIKQNVVSSFPAATMDYMPTLLDILQADHPHPSWPLDGTSLLPVLTAKSALAARAITRSKPLGWQFKTAHGNGGRSDSTCAQLRGVARGDAGGVSGASSTPVDFPVDFSRNLTHPALPQQRRYKRHDVGVDPTRYPALTAAWAEQEYKLFGCRDSGKEAWSWFLYNITSDPKVQ
jgi:arylsulfatase A-like enzyme